MIMKLIPMIICDRLELAAIASRMFGARKQGIISATCVDIRVSGCL